MTREEASKLLRAILDGKRQLDINGITGGKTIMMSEKGFEALEMAITALEQQPCEGCISRAEAKTIDEQIKIFESNAEFVRKEGDLQGCLNFRQLVDWLRDYKRLLSLFENLTEIRLEIETMLPHIIQDDYWDGYDSCRYDAISKIDSILSCLPSVKPKVDKAEKEKNNG